MNESPDYMSMNCINCNCRSEMFNFLNQEELELVYRHKTTIMFHKGETIKKQGTAMTHVISVNSGLVKVYIEGMDRRNTILRIVKPTNFIGGPGIFLDQVHHFSVSALMDTRICLIEMQVFKSLLSRNEKFSEEFMIDFSRNTLAIHQRLINQTQKEVPGRMADTLLYLLENIYHSSKFELHLTKQDLADISGMSKDSCVKILREFQREGIILQDRHELEITDLEKLKRISRLG